MKQEVICFLPCRAGSQRVVRKNIKPFSSFEHGLIQIKLRQLLDATAIDKIILTTNDLEILDYASSLKESRLQLHHRVEELSSSSTSTDQLVGHALDLIPEGHILWTHVTSPFISANKYDDLVLKYFDQIKNGYDSLISMTEIHGFVWDNNGPINYDRSIEKWPRTQTLQPFYEVNSGAFISSVALYSELNDRIGRRPYFYQMDKFTSFDIDWPEDFILAECLLEKGLVTL